MDRQRKILVVDPNPFERISCRVMLRGVEFMVLFCDDRESALEKVSKEEFELIITNILLPNKYIGLTLLQELHFMRRNTDIVVMADRPSIWDAREAIRLGASGYLERPFTCDCLMNVARKAFDRKGWIVRKACIDQFRDYSIPHPEKGNPLIYYKSGSWARHLEGNIWEAGYDMRYQPVTDSGKMGPGEHPGSDLGKADNNVKSRFFHEQPLSIHVAAGTSALAAGEPYARLFNGTGKAYPLLAPIAGTITEVNREANDVMVSHSPGDPGTDWMLWLARVRVREWEYGTVQDIEDGRVVGAYEHIPRTDPNAGKERIEENFSYAS
ncbi:MAG TPA: response regulator [Thermodesulfovibrionales bacterium]|nr:response regulator [Thermodesulfovibrionales bacterium]